MVLLLLARLPSSVVPAVILLWRCAVLCCAGSVKPCRAGQVVWNHAVAAYVSMAVEMVARAMAQLAYHIPELVTDSHWC
jgi:hypothetical protein